MTFASICGICKRAPRVGDGGAVIRLHPDDLQGDKNSQGEVIKPGCYQCCTECKDLYAPRIRERLERTPLVSDENQAPLLHPDGRPRMIIEKDQPMARNHLL